MHFKVLLKYIVLIKFCLVFHMALCSRNITLKNDVVHWHSDHPTCKLQGNVLVFPKSTQHFRGNLYNI